MLQTKQLPLQSNIALEQVSCPMCNSSKSVVIASGKDYEYNTIAGTFYFQECVNCSHLYLNPRPAISSLPLLYPSNYYTAEKPGGYSWKNNFLSWVQEKLLIKRFEPVLKLVPKGGTVLEIGFGDGKVLKQIKKIRPDLTVIGMDPQVSKNTRAILEQQNILIHECTFEESSITYNSIDLIIMTQLIEHFWDLENNIKKIKDVLKRGGLVIITTPNAGGYDRKLFSKGSWGGYYWPRHLNIFTSRSLTNLFLSNGFNLQKIRFLACPIQWAYSFQYLIDSSNLRKLKRFITPFNPVFLSIFTLLDLFALGIGLESSNMIGTFSKSKV